MMAEAPAGVEQRGIVRLSTLAVLRLIAPCGALDPESVDRRDFRR